MSEEYDTNIDGPLDQHHPIPISIVLDDPYRRQNLSASMFGVLKAEEDGDEDKVIIKHPDALALLSHALSTQVNLLDLPPHQAEAKKMETDMLFKIAGLKYKRTPLRAQLAVAQVIYNNTIDGMSTEGTFNLWLTKFTGGVREFITGTKGGEKR